MKKYYVKELVQDQDTKKFVVLTLELDDYCRMIINKVYGAMFRYEELTGNSLKDDYILRSSLLDAIGLAKRLPLNISLDGELDEEL